MPIRELFEASSRSKRQGAASIANSNRSANEERLTKMGGRHRKSANGDDRVHYQSLNNDGTFFTGSTPTGSASAARMRELMAVVQGAPAEPKQKRLAKPKRREAIESTEPEAAVNQGWLGKWMPNRQQEVMQPDDEQTEPPRVMKMHRRRTQTDVQYAAETQNGSMSISAPHGSPEAVAYDQMVVPVSDTGDQQPGATGQPYPVLEERSELI